MSSSAFNALVQCAVLRRDTEALSQRIRQCGFHIQQLTYLTNNSALNLDDIMFFNLFQKALQEVINLFEPFDKFHERMPVLKALIPDPTADMAFFPYAYQPEDPEVDGLSESRRNMRRKDRGYQNACILLWELRRIVLEDQMEYNKMEKLVEELSRH
ncbi:hypothetical protein EDD11_001689 [Mortierella claussenii]|nr:hypothetical protein EDD11_001689 [Mortierella claussenii]